MLKPRDIANVEFRPAWRGYNQQDVDEFVRKIVAAYENLYQENLRLQERTGELKLRIDEYSQTETQIDEALALARQSAADVKAAAEERAQAMLAEAKIRADETVREARRRAEEHMARAQELTRQERAFRERFRELLEAYWALLEEERRDAEQLTQTMMTVAREVAAGDEPADDPEGEPSEGYPFDDDAGGGADAFSPDSEEDFGERSDAAPTRRMGAVDPDGDM